MMDSRITAYWASVFGIAPEQFLLPGTHVIPNAGKVAGRESSWIFRHGKTCLISAPPRLVKDLHGKAAHMDAASLQSPEGIRCLFGELVVRTVGPAYQGHIAADEFRPKCSPLVRRLASDDVPALAPLAALPDWEHSGLAAGDPNLYGCFVAGQCVCVAGPIYWDPSVVNVGVITAPEHQRRGYGRATVSAVVHTAIGRGDLVLYQTLLSNCAAVRLAESLGCRQYAQHVCVHLRPR